MPRRLCAALVVKCWTLALVLACLAAFVAVPAVLAVLVPGDEGSGK